MTPFSNSQPTATMSTKGALKNNKDVSLSFKPMKFHFIRINSILFEPKSFEIKTVETLSFIIKITEIMNLYNLEIFNQNLH